MSKRQTKVIGGREYHADRPADCRHCYFWRGPKKGCTLGEDNCYYLVKAVLSKQEEKCMDCPYHPAGPCVTASCYKDMEQHLRRLRAGKKKAAATAVEYTPVRGLPS